MQTIKFTVTAAELQALGANAENVEFFEESDVSELDCYRTERSMLDQAAGWLGGFTITFDTPDNWTVEEIQEQYLIDLGYFFGD
jgi:hypothetical protein